MKKAIGILVALTMIVAMVAACGGGGGSGATLVGISMPTQSSERWISDGNVLKSILEERGYEVDLQYAEDDIPTQLSQIEAMITRGAKVLVIAAIDASTLVPVLDQAGEEGV